MRFEETGPMPGDADALRVALDESAAMRMRELRDRMKSQGPEYAAKQMGLTAPVPVVATEEGMRPRGIGGRPLLHADAGFGMAPAFAGYGRAAPVSARNEVGGVYRSAAGHAGVMPVMFTGAYTPPVKGMEGAAGAAPPAPLSDDEAMKRATDTAFGRKGAVELSFAGEGDKRRVVVDSRGSWNPDALAAAKAAQDARRKALGDRLPTFAPMADREEAIRKRAMAEATARNLRQQGVNPVRAAMMGRASAAGGDFMESMLQQYAAAGDPTAAGMLWDSKMKQADAAARRGDIETEGRFRKEAAQIAADAEKAKAESAYKGGIAAAEIAAKPEAEKAAAMREGNAQEIQWRTKAEEAKTREAEAREKDDLGKNLIARLTEISAEQTRLSGLEQTDDVKSRIASLQSERDAISAKLNELGGVAGTPAAPVTGATSSADKAQADVVAAEKAKMAATPVSGHGGDATITRGVADVIAPKLNEPGGYAWATQYVSSTMGVDIATARRLVDEYKRVAAPPLSVRGGGPTYSFPSYAFKPR